MNTINFILPEFSADKKININLLDIYTKYPETIRSNINIYGFYGIFPNCIWNGGRVVLSEFYSKNQIQEIFTIYNHYYKLPLRLTFTNPFIEEKHCYDTYSNLIAECGHNGMNEILVTSPILEAYLRANYPNYKYCKSVTSTENNIYDVKNYHISVLPKYFNNNFQLLQSLPLEDRRNLEIICNDDCIDNCPHTYQHYKNIGEAQLQYCMTDNIQCIMKYNTAFPYRKIQTLQQQVVYNDIINNYLPLDFQHFKLCGRESSAKRKLNWLNYIFKEEYHDDIFVKMWNCK